MENIAREALRMDAQQRGRRCVHVSHAQRHGLFHAVPHASFETEDPEKPVLGRKVRLGDFRRKKKRGGFH
jgi:hypothetical protein